MSKAARYAVFFIVLLASAGIALKLRSVSASVYNKAMTDDERYYLPPAKWIRILSLGFSEAAADLIWIKTVVYFGGRFLEHNDDTKSNHTVNYLKTAVELDPYMRSLYTSGSALTLFQNAGIVSESTVKMANELLEDGTKVFPNDGEIFFMLGFNHYYEMRPFVPKNPDDPKRKYHIEVGTRYIGLASLMDGAPSYAALLATTLIAKQGLEEVTIEHLRNMLMKETDPKIRDVLKTKLREELGKTAEMDIQESERLIAKWKKEFPFISYDFYLILQNPVSIEEILNPMYYSNKLLGLDESDNSSFTFQSED